MKKNRIKITIFIAIFIGICLFVYSNHKEQSLLMKHFEQSLMPSKTLKPIDIRYLETHVDNTEIAKIYIKHLLSKSSDVKSKKTAFEIAKKVLIKIPLDHEAYYLLANSLGNSESNFRQNLMRRAWELDTNSFNYTLALARYFKDSTQLETALSFYEKTLGLPKNRSSKILSDIHCEMAHVYSLLGNQVRFSDSIDKAKKANPFNWRVDFELSRDNYSRNQLLLAAGFFASSIEKLQKYSGNKPDEKAIFDASFNSLIKMLISFKNFEEIRNLYNVLAFKTKDYEGILFEINKRFSKDPLLADLIWEGPLRITLTGQIGEIKNSNRGCQTQRSSQKILDDGAELIDIDYSPSSGFIDFWYVSPALTMTSKRTSAVIVIESTNKINDRQMAVEIAGKLYYSNSRAIEKKKNEYSLLTKNIRSYLYDALLLKPAGDRITVDRIGFNTVCTSGKYKIKEISIYLEDE